MVCLTYYSCVRKDLCTITFLNIYMAISYRKFREYTNTFPRYPQKVADYVHYTELKKIPRGEAPQRDFFFLADTVTGGKKKQKATVSLLSVRLIHLRIITALLIFNIAHANHRYTRGFAPPLPPVLQRNYFSNRPFPSRVGVYS